MKQFISLVLLLVLAAASTPAFARDVYLNGVKLGPDVLIKNQQFPACEVAIDEKGDVYITAKGFKIDVAPAKDDAPKGKEAAPSDGKLTKRYWLISKQVKRGQAQYDIDVFVNGKHVKKVRSADDPVVLEITKFVKPGDNTVQLVAKKDMGDKRLSSSPTDTIEVVLGEGTVGGGTVSITKPVVSYSRNAQETKNFTDELSFTGR
jgi:hypothetical protein